MAKFGPKVYASDIINTKKHWAIGTIWNAEGSKVEKRCIACVLLTISLKML